MPRAVNGDVRCTNLTNVTRSCTHRVAQRLPTVLCAGCQRVLAAKHRLAAICVPRRSALTAEVRALVVVVVHIAPGGPVSDVWKHTILKAMHCVLVVKCGSEHVATNKFFVQKIFCSTCDHF